MSLQQINVGTNPNDGTGDPIRTAFQKANLAIAAADTALPVFNVKAAAYGALGNSNGTTGNGNNDLPAVQAAIAAAQAAGGGVVYFPPGIYRLPTASLQVTASNVHIKGAAQGASVLCFDSTYVQNGTYGRLLFAGTSGALIKNVTCRDISIMNVANVYAGSTVNTSYAATSPSRTDCYDGANSLVTFSYCQYFAMKDCELYYAPNFGAYAQYSSDGIFCENYIHDTTADFFHVQYGCSRISIVNNRGNDNIDDAIGIGFEGAINTDIAIQGNVFYNSGGGVAIYGPADGVVVKGNVVDTTYLCGLKLAPLYDGNGNSVVAASYIRNVNVEGNLIKNAGTNTNTGPWGQGQRAQGTSVGIELNDTQGALSNIKVNGNEVYNSVNGHIWCLATAGGSNSNIAITGNLCSGVASIGGLGNAAGNNGGKSNASPVSGVYPGIWLEGVTDQALVSDNLVVGAYSQGLLADASIVANTGVIRVADNIFNGIDTANSSVYGVQITSGSGLSSGNIVTKSSGSLAGGESITNNLGSTAGTVVAFSLGAETQIAADTFNRANVTPVAGGLGSTPTGGLTWAGDPAGISSNAAYFGTGTYQQAIVNSGYVNVDVSVTAQLPGTSAARMMALATSNGSHSGGFLGMDTGYGSNKGQLFYYDGSAVHTLGSAFTAPAAGSHVLRITQDDNTCTAYIDGTQVATGTYSSLPTTQYYVGFADDAGGGAVTFTNFSVSKFAS